MKKVIYTIAFIHLCIIFLAIFHFTDNLGKGKSPWIEKSASFYCGMNYSLWHFGFFSHHSGRSNELEIVTYNINGDTKTYTTSDGFDFFVSNKDMKNRFYGFKVYNATDTLIRDLCARSVATKMMNLYPGTVRVTYSIRSVAYPAIEKDYKQRRTITQTLYSTDFVLGRFLE